MGTLLVPLGVPLRRASSAPARRGEAKEEGPTEDVATEMAVLGEVEEPAPADTPAPFALPFARRDLDRLRLILLSQRRLREVQRSPGLKQVLAGRGYFEEALRWLEIHGGADGPALAAHWRDLDAGDVKALPEPAGAVPPPAGEERRPGRRRRRHRRRRPRPSPAAPA